MRRAIRALVCAVLLSTALSTPAVARSGNGQLAVVLGGFLYTVNEDGSGQRPLPVPEGSTISELAFSPDGNRLAIVRNQKIAVLDLRSGSLTNVADGVNPAWTADGNRLLYRSGPEVLMLPLAGGAPETRLKLAEDTMAVALGSWLQWAVVLTDGLQINGGPKVPVAVQHVPAWAPDGSKLAYVSGGQLFTLDVGSEQQTDLHAAATGSPRWSPDSTKLVYSTGSELRVQPLDGDSKLVIRSDSGVGPADWQPCVGDITVACSSSAPVVPPHCTVTSRSVTTLADEPVTLPEPPCSDPESRPLSWVVVKPPSNGTLSGFVYTPAPGFTGTDSVQLRASNGAAESETFYYTVTVNPRPRVPQPGASTRGTVLVTGAPFLSARTTPRLDRRRRALVRVYCDQDCTLNVRLTGRLRGRKRSLNGARVRRKAVAQRVISLRLRLPAKPRGKLRTVWITGSVRNAAGDTRTVKLPVRLPR